MFSPYFIPPETMINAARYQDMLCSCYDPWGESVLRCWRCFSTRRGPHLTQRVPLVLRKKARRSRASVELALTRRPPLLRTHLIHWCRPQHVLMFKGGSHSSSCSPPNLRSTSQQPLLLSIVPLETFSSSLRQRDLTQDEHLVCIHCEVRALMHPLHR